MTAWLVALILTSPDPGPFGVHVWIAGRPESIHAIGPWPVQGLYEVGP